MFFRTESVSIVKLTRSALCINYFCSFKRALDHSSFQVSQWTHPFGVFEVPFCGILKAGFWNSPENENFLHCRNTVRKSEMKDTLALKHVEKAHYGFRRTFKNVLMKCRICFFRLLSTETILENLIVGNLPVGTMHTIC